MSNSDKFVGPRNLTEAGSSHRSDSQHGSEAIQRSANHEGQTLRQMEKLVPELKKKDLENMQPDERDDQVMFAEELTVKWVHTFLDEIYRIEDFFKSKQTELINQFIGLQDKFRIKTDHFEHDVKSKKSGKSGKKGTVNEDESSAKDSLGVGATRSPSPSNYISPAMEKRTKTQTNLEQGAMSIG